MGKSSVDRAKMHQAVGQIEGKVTSITGHQRTLGDQIHGLVGTPGWSGNAASAFLRAFQDFDGQFKNVLDSLTDLKDKLQSGLGSYTSTEDDQTQSVSTITGAL